MIDSSSTSTFTVHYGTEQRHEKPVERSRQHVDIPSAWMGVKISQGRVRKITRNVAVYGTVEVECYSRKRVEYGKVDYCGDVLLVVQDGTIWRAIDRKVFSGCKEAKQ
jgi:16S rRNA U516 pseudouridylate synthase RsuA-like enzyme